MAAQNDLPVRSGEAPLPRTKPRRPYSTFDDDISTDGDDVGRQNDSLMERFLHNLMAALAAPNA
jgi:hypothetical protein